MATPRTSFLPPNLRRTPGSTARHVAVALLAATGVVLVPLPAAATSHRPAAQAAADMAARAGDLEMVNEQVNQARDELAARQSAAAAAAAAATQAQTAVAAARERVRGIARSAFTGESLSSFQALMTSDSAKDFVDRVSTLQLIAGRQNEELQAVAAASEAAARAQATAARAVDQARAQVNAVTVRQADLQTQVDRYRAEFQALGVAEQRQVARAADGARSAPSGAGTATAPARGAAGPSGPSGRSVPSAPSGPEGAGSQAEQIAVRTALAQRGKPYAWGAVGPASFDCSGLLLYAYKAAGLTLPRSSKQQAAAGRAVAIADLQPGDLVYFYNPVSHIGMYIGNGQMVHSSTFGQPVDVESIFGLGAGALRGARHVAP